MSTVPTKWPDPLLNDRLNYSLNPLKWHNTSMKWVDQANRSKQFIAFKILEQSGANALAVITGVCATAFLSMKFVVSVSGCLIKNKLAVIRLITCDNRENRPYHSLPGVKDCFLTAQKAFYQYLGIFPSILGVAVVGSNYNAKAQRKLGNYEDYDVKIEKESEASLKRLKSLMDKQINNMMITTQNPAKQRAMDLATSLLSPEAKKSSREKAKDQLISKEDVYLLENPRKFFETEAKHRLRERTKLSKEEISQYNKFVEVLVEEGVKKFNNESNQFEKINVKCSKFLRKILGRKADLTRYDFVVQQKIIAAIDKKLKNESEKLDQIVAEAREPIIQKFVSDNLLRIPGETIPGYLSLVKVLLEESINKMKNLPNEADQTKERCLAYLKLRTDASINQNEILAVNDAFINQLVKVHVDKKFSHESKEKAFIDFKRMAVGLMSFKENGVKSNPENDQHVLSFKGAKFKSFAEKKEFWELFDKKINANSDVKRLYVNLSSVLPMKKVAKEYPWTPLKKPALNEVFAKQAAKNKEEKTITVQDVKIDLSKREETLNEIQAVKNKLSKVKHTAAYIITEFVSKSPNRHERVVQNCEDLDSELKKDRRLLLAFLDEKALEVLTQSKDRITSADRRVKAYQIAATVMNNMFEEMFNTQPAEEVMNDEIEALKDKSSDSEETYSSETSDDEEMTIRHLEKIVVESDLESENELDDSESEHEAMISTMDNTTTATTTTTTTATAVTTTTTAAATTTTTTTTATTALTGTTTTTAPKTPPASTVKTAELKIEENESSSSSVVIPQPKFINEDSTRAWYSPILDLFGKNSEKSEVPEVAEDTQTVREEADDAKSLFADLI